jgi:hypothetical protein
VTVYEKSNRFMALIWLTICAAALLMLAAMIMSGCTDTLKGDINANQAPIVHFVNIPPENTNFSYNPEVYWFGTDADGRIEYYRYLVAKAEDVDGTDDDAARVWVAGLDDTMWTYVDIEPASSDPQTAHTIPLTADMDDPVRTYVAQYVFLQAFDDDGAGSRVALKSLNRNDHQPATRIINTIRNDTPFVNAEVAGGIVTGVKLTWQGSDVRDYDQQGLVAPPFEYEWRLFGPFTSQDSAEIYDNFRRIVWITDEAEIKEIGDTLYFYDSTLIEDDTGSWWEYDTTVIELRAQLGDTTQSNAVLGFYCDTLIDISDPAYFGDAKTADSSWNGYDPWVYDMADTLYDVYGKVDDRDRGDATLTRYFIFWVRSRDDALVADPTPAFAIFPVVDPRYERDILVIDFTIPGDPPYSQINIRDSSYSMLKHVFYDFIHRWNPEIVFDTTALDHDYIRAADFWARPLPIQKLLSYKMMILYSDWVRSSDFMSGADINHPRVMTAIDAGINAWVTGRAFLYGNLSVGDAFPPVPDEINYYFGVRSVFFSSWSAFFRGANPFNGYEEIRMEDFVGAYSMDESRWPHLDIDTALLHARYKYWEGGSPLVVDCPWIPDTAALPEVNWCQKAYGTEVMYLYKSMYGGNHPLGYPFNAMEGAPVAHRLETNLFRTAWFMFTPMAIDSVQMQQLANSVLAWLYDPTLGSSTVNEKRYPDAMTKVSVDVARENLDKRNDEFISRQLDD